MQGQLPSTISEGSGDAVLTHIGAPDFLFYERLKDPNVLYVVC